MEFDSKRAARIDLKKRRQREDAKMAKRSVRTLDEDLDNEDKELEYDYLRRINQHR